LALAANKSFSNRCMLMGVLAAVTLGCGATKVSELLLPHLTNNNDISKKTAEINKFAFFENTDNE
jgi:hypothetical protein